MLNPALSGVVFVVLGQGCKGLDEGLEPVTIVFPERPDIALSARESVCARVRESVSE